MAHKALHDLPTQPSTPQCYLSSLICFAFPRAVSSPATLASLLLVEHSRHASASGPLYLESPQPGKPSLSPGIHMAHSFISFAHTPFSCEDFSVRHSLPNLLKIISHRSTPSTPSLSFFSVACITLGHTLYWLSQAPHLQIPLILQNPPGSYRLLYPQWIKQSY